MKWAGGWGDGLSFRPVPELRDHPTPSRISLRSMRADPPPPGEGKKRDAGIANLGSGDPSVLALVDQRALLDPWHHVAQLDADLLDRMRGELGAGGLERGLVDLVLEHPVAGGLGRVGVV